MMTPAARDFLYDLLDTPSPTGFEMPGQRKWAGYIRPFADSVENDVYGTTWATLDGQPSQGQSQSKSIMLEAHADEIGFIVKQVTKEGYLRLDRVGGSDTATARGRRVQLLGDKGPVLGIIGNTAIHLRKDLSDEKAPKIHELYVDIGASNADEVKELGIRVGHPAVYSDSALPFGKNRIVGRALDNRIGGFILTQVFERLAAERGSLASTVYAVNAVQEEIGGNGARMIAHRLAPDICIVLDVTHATDTPGIDQAVHGECVLGGGPSITHGTCNHPVVIARLLECAEAAGIPIQHESSSRYSGTDTDVIFNSRDGVPSALISLPLRYMHSIVEMASLDDVEKVIALLVAFVKSVKPGDDFSHRL
ncbi:MAG: M42 family metallopeptidase [Chthoniobacterales bacterium]